jgi:hypothetical protein
MPSVAVNTEINPATTPIVVALNILQERVKVLSHELPGVTFGYIGNLERWGDDRSWAVFLPPPLVSAPSTIRSASAPRRSFPPPSINGTRSWSCATLLPTTSEFALD